MPTLIKEDLNNTVRSTSPWSSYVDAVERDAGARIAHKAFFDTDDHVDRIVQVSNIIRGFFGRNPNYITARYGRGRPFTNVKIQDVGVTLSRTKVKDKNEKLYGPLLDIPGVEPISKNGHLSVRIY